MQDGRTPVAEMKVPRASIPPSRIEREGLFSGVGFSQCAYS